MRTLCSTLLVLSLTFLMSSLALADEYDPPSGYYDSASGLTGSALKNALHNIIDDHTKLSYTPGVWTALREIDQDPSNSNNILDLYSNRSIPKTDQDGSSSATYVWNREHSFPKSFGFNYESWPPYTDVHHLFACEKNINSTRNNHYFDWATGGTEYAVVGTTDVNKLLGDAFEPWDGRKGDVARALFYMDTRYNGDQSNEPDLSLDDGQPVTGEPHMAKISTLLEWHALDPVVQWDRRRNHLVYTNYQHNRNPYVDHPEYVCSVYGGAACSGPTPTPTATTTASPTPTPTPTPTSTGGTLTSGVTVSDSVAQGAWDHYSIYVPAGATQLQVVMTGTNDADVYVKQGSQPSSSSWDFRPYVNGSSETVTVNSSSNPTLVAGSMYYVSVYGYSSSTSSYSLTATVTGSSTPTPSPTATATATASPTPSSAANLFFTEYVEGSSYNKAVEIYNGSGSSVSLSGWSVQVFFNGGTSAGSTINLSGTLAAGDVYVIADDSSVSALTSVSDMLFSNSSWNGDDAVALVYSGTTVDVIGRIGQDPGSAWSANGVSTQDQTLRRKSTVTSGDSNGTDTFDPSVQWIAYSIDDFSNLGTAGSTSPTPSPTPTPTPSPSPSPTASPSPSPTPSSGGLTSGVTISDSVANGAWDHYTIYVPSNATQLQIVMTGNNDADLYVKSGSQPTASSWDFRPYVGGSSETVTINSSSSPALNTGVTYYISVYGYASATSSYTLTPTITTSSATPSPTPSPTPTATATSTPTGGDMTSGVTISESVAYHSWTHHSIYVPAGSSQLQVVMTGSGDGDVYVKQGSQPTSSSWDFRPYAWGSSETVTVNGSSSPSLVAGSMYYISVYGYEASSINLTATIN